MTRAWWLWGMLLLPLAQAIPASGELLLDGPLHIDAASAHEAAAEAIFCDETSDAVSWTLTAPKVEVRVFWVETARIEEVVSIGSETSRDERTYVLTDVVIDIVAGAQDGWFGAKLDPEAPLRVNALGPSIVAPASASRWGDGISAEGDDLPFFAHDFAQPFLDVGPWRQATYAGPLVAKVEGLDLRIAARENTSLLETSRTRGAGPVVRMNDTWVVLTARDATLAFDVPGCRMGATTDVVRWDGLARADARQGALETDSTAFYADASPVTMEGAFEGRLAPTEDGAGLDLALAGDLHATSLPAAAIVKAAPAQGLPWLLLLVGMALGGAGTLAYVLRERRRQRARVPPADACLALAHYAMETNHYDEALEWIERAKAQSPTSLRIRWEEAHVLQQLGRADEAIATYEALDQAGSDGEAAFHLALLHAEAGRLTVAAECLTRALHGSPALLLEVEEDERLTPLLRSPEVKAAVARAKRELGLP